MEDELQTNEELPEYCDVAAFKEAAKQFDKLGVILASDTCDPCKVLKQRISEVDIPVPLVNIPLDACPNLVDYFQVRVLPTIVIMNKGQEIGRLEGAGEDIIEKLKGV